MDTVLQSAHDAVGIPLRYAESGSNLARAALAGSGTCVELEHYPRHDVIDAHSATRYFYHAHGSRKKPADEHGHFHVFIHQGASYSHVVGISLNALGHPLRLFTTNRWVTGEQWTSAAQLQQALAHFSLRTSGRLAPVARWVQSMVRLHRDPIAQLLEQRDATMQRRSAQQGWEALCEDRTLDVVTQRKISLAHTIRQLGC